MPDPVSKKGPARRLLAYLVRYWHLLLLGTVASALASGFEASLPVIVGQVIDILAGKKDGLVFNLFLLGLEKPRLAVVNFLPIWIFFVIAMSGVFAFFRSYLISYTGQKVVLAIRDRVFGHLVHLPLRYYDVRQSGEVVSRVTNDVHVLQESANSLKDVLHAVTTLAVVLSIMFFRSWKLTVLVIVSFPALGIIINALGAKSRRAGREIQGKIADLTAFLTENLASIKLIKSFRREDFEFGRFRKKNLEAFRAWMYGVKVEAILRPMMEVVSGLGIAGFFWYGCHLVLSGRMTTGSLLEFTGLIVIMYQPIKTVGRVNVLIQKALAAAARVFEVADEPSERDLRGAGTYAGRIEGSVVFDNVSFSYDAVNYVLDGVSIEAAPGEVTAVVGPSGAGKSTLVSLIPRFYEPSAGRLLVDGRDVREYDLDALRDQISLVPQETLLFADSVYNNILYGRLDADVDEVYEAAHAANADEFIRRFPDGYETYIGERGVQISGGQRQRISIARAVLRDPRILILDEATSSLDAESERLIQTALERLMVGRTTFVIAHRLSTVRRADRIVVLEDGRVAETGTHDELVLNGGAYSRLLEAQLAR
jgi:subfamily B ATP-binding cassette protein MsbA